jgi:hypothetical protein
VKRSTALRYLRRAFFIVGILGMLVTVNHRTPAQDIGEETCFDLGGFCDVEAVAAIADSTDDVEIDAYATEEIVSFDLLEFGDEAVIDAGLFEDDALVDEVEGDDDGTGFAEADLIDPVALGSVYTMEGDFYIFDLEEGPVFLGSLFAQVVAAAPEIDETSEPGDHSGVSGQLTINGFALFDQFDGTVNISNIPGLHWASTFQGSPDGTQITLSYTIDKNAKSGDQELSLGTRFGLSNSVTFTIFDPPPLVTSVQPDVWQAGTQIPITVGGQHFGPCAKISVSGPGVTGSTTDPGPSTDIQVKGTVTIDINSPGGQATVTVTSDGEACSGFLGGPGEPPTGSNKATIEPADATPKIIFRGNNIAGQTKPVDPGQQVVLTVQPASGFTIASQSWQIDTDFVAAGYDAAADASSGKVKQFDQSTLQNNSIVFFWVVPFATTTVTVNATYSNRQDPVSASATFNLGGPSNVTIQAPMNSVNVAHSFDQAGADLGLFLNLGNPPAHQPGIKFTASPSNPGNGTYSWVQLIKQTDDQMATDFGIQVCSPQGLNPASPALDSKYPYPSTSANTTEDSPGTPLDTSLASLHEVAKIGFDATMYLLWTPNASGCDKSQGACVIPIPLGHVHWFWNGDAVNQEVLDATTHTIKDQWTPGCGSPIADPFMGSVNVNDYPQWTFRIEGAFTGHPTPNNCRIVQ